MYPKSLDLDDDIKVAQANINDVQVKNKKQLNIRRDGEGSWEVPGLQTYLQTGEKSDPICNSSGCTQYLHPEAKDGWPMNYPVPHFGVDVDVAGLLENVGVAEQIVGHKWTSMGTEFNKFKFHNKAKDVDYNFAPKLEDDMIDSQNSLKIAQGLRKKEYMPEINNFSFDEVKKMKFY